MMNDIIADALTRIRNAAMRRLEVATLLHSNTVVGVLNVLLQKEYGIVTGKHLFGDCVPFV